MPVSYPKNLSTMNRYVLKMYFFCMQLVIFSHHSCKFLIWSVMNKYQRKKYVQAVYIYNPTLNASQKSKNNYR